jgi:N-acetyl-anhydromuramyl-L-alanine amidase AmpD
MTAFLKLYPPRRSQYRSPRRATPTGCIVIHTAETAPDFAPPDTAAERTAEFIRRRSDAGSYHLLVDSDTIIQLVEFRDEAFHDGTGSNRWSIGASVATQAHTWDEAPARWVTAVLTNLAQACADANSWLLDNGYPGCPPVRITKSESDAGKGGFVSHAERDPARRSDPGAEFPWEQFLELYAAKTKQTDSGEDTMSEHSEAALATLAIAQMYDTFADRKIDSAAALEWQLDRYLTAQDPVAHLKVLASELEQE